MAPKTRDNFSPGEIVIEIAGPQNNNLVGFVPLAATLRGRWDPSKCKLDSDPDTRPNTLPLVPGMMIALDLKRRTLRAVDPLGFKENEDLLRDLSRIATEGLYGTRTKFVAEKETRLENQTPSELKTALWMMWRLVDDKLAEEVNGSMPAWKDILAMEGNLLCRAGSQMLDWTPDGNQKRGRFMEEDELKDLIERLEARERTQAA